MSQQVSTKIEIQIDNRNRATALFRIFMAIPTAIFISTFSDYTTNYDYAAGIFVLPVVLTLVFRGVYPSYILNFNKAFMNLSLRAAAYLFLLTDEYPTIEANEKFTVEFPEIEGGKKLSRGLPLVKWFLAIPLYIVGIVYALYALMLTLVAWFTIVFTGVYPEWCAAGVIGTVSYWNRVYGYAFVLVTDEYPSFSL